MTTTYWTVSISLFAFIVFAILLLIFKRKKNFQVYFLVLASSLPLVSLLRQGVHQSGDFAINISKSMDLWHSLTFGIFPVHWAPLLNANYGYPLFLFTYPLPYYSIALFKLLGFSFIASEKIVIGSVFILSGLSMYFLLRHFLKQTPSLLGSILYLFAPYHLVDMHFRVALGELFAFSILPLVLLGLLKKNVTLISLSYASLLLSHQAISVITTPFLFAFPFFLKRNQKKFLVSFGGLSIGLLLSSFFWLPVVEGITHTIQSKASEVSFESIMLFLISPWRGGFLYQGPIGQLSYPLGFVQIGLLFFTGWLLIKGKLKRVDKKRIIMSFTIFFILFALLFPVSLPIWKAVPFMTSFQFSYRLMLPMSFIVAIIGAISSSYIKREWIIYILIFLAMLTTILNWGTRAMLSDITDENLFARLPTSTHEGEGLQPAAPKDRDEKNLWEKSVPEQTLSTYKGQSTISKIRRTPTLHEYQVTAHSDSSFVEHTYYFPGWKLYVNDTLYPISWIDSAKSNYIRFKLKKGEYNVILRYEDTLSVSLGNTLSLFGVLILLSYLLIPHRRR